MKNKITLCFLSLIAICFSVAAFSNNSDWHKKYVKSELVKLDVSKIEASITPGVATYETYDIAFRRNYIRVSYSSPKVQNKALPLCKNIWLLNCQIALK